MTLLFLTLITAFTPFGMHAMTSLQRANAWNQNRKAENAVKEANKGEARFEKELGDFSSFIQDEGYLELYTSVLQEYNQNRNRENDFASYVKSERTFRHPASIRMPQYRHIYRPLSKVIKSYKEIKTVMEADANLAQQIFDSLDARSIGDLRERLKDYDEDVAGNDTSAFSAEIDYLNDQLNGQRVGAVLYLVQMGLDQRKIVSDINDMQDMAEDVESLLEQLDEDEFWKKMHSTFVKRYTDSALDAEEHPYTFPVDYYDSYLDIPLPKLIATFNKRLDQLKDTAAQIMEKAKPYFSQSAIPSEFDLLLRREQANKYCVDGYLGYWMQKLVDHYNEMVLSGIRFVGGRAALYNLNARIIKEVYSPLLSSIPSLKETAFADPAAMTTYNPADLTFSLDDDSLNSVIELKNEYDIKKSSYSVTGNTILFGSEGIKRASILGPEQRSGVLELRAMRRIMYALTIIFESLMTGSFDASSHMNDDFGSIPSDCIIRPITAQTGAV